MGDRFTDGPKSTGDVGDPVADSIRAEQNQDAAPHHDEANNMEEFDAEVTLSRSIKAPSEEHAEQLVRQMAADHFKKKAANKTWTLEGSSVEKVENDE